MEVVRQGQGESECWGRRHHFPTPLSPPRGLHPDLPPLLPSLQVLWAATEAGTSLDLLASVDLEACHPPCPQTPIDHLP